MTPSLYATLLLVSAVFSTGLAIYISGWRRVPGRHELALMLGALALWAVFGALEVLAVTVPAKAFMSALSYLGSQTCPVFFVLFALRYTQQESRYPWLAGPWLFFVPAISIVLAFTNQAHELVWASVSLPENGPLGPAFYARGRWFPLMMTYSYLLMLAGVFLLLRSAWRQRALHRWQLLLFALAALAPWLGSVLYMVRIPWLNGYDASPLGFVVGVPLIVLTVRKFGLMDLFPIARERIIENLPEGVLLVDAEGRVVDYNATAARMTGLDMIGDPVGKPLAEATMVWPELVAFASGPAPALRLLERRANPHETHLVEADLSIIQLHPASPPGRMMVFRDITHRRRVEQALVESEQRYRLATRKTGQIVYEYNLETGKLYWAGAIPEITGYPEEEFANFRMKEWLEHVHPEDQAVAARRIAKAERNHSDVTLMYRFRRKDDRYVYLEERGSVVVNPETGAARMIGTMSDVTPTLLLQEQLHQSQKMEAIGRLAGGIAHDFNNLIMVILNSADILRSELPAPYAGRPELEDILHASGRAAELTRQLLMFSRKQPLRRTHHHPRQFLPEVRKLLQRIVGEDISLDLTMDSELPTVYIDVALVELAIMNLAVNARDAMPGGGRLSLRATAGAIPAGEVVRMTEKPSSLDGEYVRIDVEDSGTGIPEEHLKRIFEPFFTTKTVGKGTGLGLSTVLGIVRQHEGYIAAKSTPGEGTCFSIFLPVATERPEDTPKYMTVPSPHPELTILVVEDDPAIRRLILVMLRDHGYTVMEAEDGRVAVDLLDRGSVRPDLLITDVVMPEIDGYRLASIYRKRCPGIRVGYVSGYPRDYLEQQIAEENPFLLSKPFTRSDLLTFVQALIQAPPNPDGGT
ncbi:MAG TPA: histidine kinase N-terminal 7TM domain-containing protein [Kiritimatiellia bacterium]|nr:histidine kinase N-terminal 7TM domain-containing protein [Kiritimatiellia bacterium]